jgi:hypothetical protein
MVDLQRRQCHRHHLLHMAHRPNQLTVPVRPIRCDRDLTVNPIHEIAVAM